LTIVRLVDDTVYPPTGVIGSIERIVTAYIYARDDMSVPNVQCGDVLRVHRIQVRARAAGLCTRACVQCKVEPPTLLAERVSLSGLIDGPCRMSVTVLDGNATVDDMRRQRPKWLSAHETYQWNENDEQHVSWRACARTECLIVRAQVHKLKTWYTTVSTQQQPITSENGMDTMRVTPAPLPPAIQNAAATDLLTSLEDFPVRTYRDVRVQVLGVLYQWKEDNPLIVRVWDGSVMKV